MTDKGTIHSYLDEFYRRELPRYVDQPINLIEIGVWQGGSMQLWASLLPCANIYGIDITLPPMAYDPRIHLINGDAYTPEVAESLPEAHIIIDDGPHTLVSQMLGIMLYLPKLVPGGLYVVEDVQHISHIHSLTGYVNHINPTAFIETYDLRAIKGRYDDILFVIRK